MITICAIIAVRNNPFTLPSVLRHYQNNQIEVIMIDNGSTDKTTEVIQQFIGSPIKEVHQLEFNDIFEWEKLLVFKQDIVKTIDADWVIHADADEIFESPRLGESLREFIERCSDTGADIIDCDEFVFVPKNENENFNNSDFIEKMDHYYHFSPPGRTLHRFSRVSSTQLGWANSGGHALDLNERTLSTERARLRHYIGLNLDSLRSQYLGRVFSGKELVRGWHINRVLTTSDLIKPPPAEKLFSLKRDGWCTHRPEVKHLIFNQHKLYQPPAIISRNEIKQAVPFIIGTGRCGGTMLRLMLDKHPDLAITPETGWLISSINSLNENPNDILSFREKLISEPTWADMHINSKQLTTILNQHDKYYPLDTIQRIYLHYAATLGKKRFGNKTPRHSLAMHTIASAFPEARFIHIIRDGRDVALSMRKAYWVHDKSIRALAIFWTWRIANARQQAQFLPYYLEVKYEDLLRNPKSILNKIAKFIGIPYNSIQLDAYLTASQRLEELTDITRNGKKISSTLRRSVHSMTSKPPDKSQIGLWRKELSKEEIILFERIAGEMLSDLGYERYT